MEVFITWSGERSKAVADYLHDWLPNVIQALEPWVSLADIDKGGRPGSDIAKHLESANFGVLCITPENQTAPWLLFEAGALSKSVEHSHVVPYLLTMQPSDLQPPLAQFQAAQATNSDTWDLITTMNKTIETERRLDDDRLRRAFAREWPILEKQLSDIPETQERLPATRSIDEKVDEILAIVRSQTRSLPITLQTNIVDLLRSTPSEGYNIVAGGFPSFMNWRHCPKCGVLIHPSETTHDCGWSIRDVPPS